MREAYNESEGPLKRDLQLITDGILMTQFIHDLRSEDVGYTESLLICIVSLPYWGTAFMMFLDCPRYNGGR